MSTKHPPQQGVGEEIASNAATSLPARPTPKPKCQYTPRHRLLKRTLHPRNQPEHPGHARLHPSAPNAHSHNSFLTLVPPNSETSLFAHAAANRLATVRRLNQHINATKTKQNFTTRSSVWHHCATYPYTTSLLLDAQSSISLSTRADAKLYSYIFKQLHLPLITLCMRWQAKKSNCMTEPTKPTTTTASKIRSAAPCPPSSTSSAIQILTTEPSHTPSRSFHSPPRSPHHSFILS